MDDKEKSLEKATDNNYEQYDIQGLITTISMFRNTLLGIGKGIRSVSTAIRPVISPLKELPKSLSHLVPKFAEALGVLMIEDKAIGILSRIQLIWFSGLDAKLANEIMESTNPEAIIVQHLEDTNYVEIETIISKSSEYELLKAKDDLYSQAVYAYHEKHYELACMGFLCIIDCLLSKVSGDVRVKNDPRIQKIKNKITMDELLDNYEISLFIAVTNFESATKFIFDYSPFTEAEPDNLNRHWLAHGRTCKEYRQIDCVKLINLIFALLIIGSTEVTGENRISENKNVVIDNR